MTSEKAYSVEARLNALIAAGGIPLTVFKAGGTSRSSTTTTDDPDLQLPLLSGVNYMLTMWLWFEGAHSPGDMKIRWYTGDNNGGYSVLHNEGGATGVTNSTLFNTLGSFVAPLACNGIGTPNAAWFTGYTIPSADTTLILQWAVNTAAASNTTLHGGSWMTATPVH